MKYWLPLLLAAALSPLPALAVPQTLGYQGKIAVSGIAFTGTGNFRFSLLEGATVLWNQDGTTTGAPAGGVALAVDRGVFSVALGDTAQAGMSALPAGLLQGKNNVSLRVWFNDGPHGWQQLSPDARIPAEPMALSAELAETVTNGAITSAKLAAGAVTKPKIADNAVTTVKIAAGAVSTADLAADAVSATQLAAGAVTAAKLTPNAAATAAAAQGLGFLPSGSGILSLNANDAALTGQGFSRVGQALPGLGAWDLDSVAPRVAFLTRACWTGSQMLLFGGRPSMPQMGRSYSPATGKWANLVATGLDLVEPDNTTWTWTGTEAICWNGYQSTTSADAIYNPTTKTWRALAQAGAPPRTIYSSTVWSGQELLVWGGLSSTTIQPVATGGRFNPVTNLWSTITGIGAPTARHSATKVWTGTEMIVWGGQLATAATTNTGARYNPATNAWTTMSTVGAPSARYQHDAIWTGSKMIVWGDRATPNGNAYDPATDTWTPIATANQPTPRDGPGMVWTGTEMIVWGGLDFTGGGYTPLGDGARYNPATDTWTPIPSSLPNSPLAVKGPNVLWTGTEMIVFGGSTDADGPLNVGARYNPATNAWTTIDVPPQVPAMPSPIGGWTGTELLAFHADQPLADTFTKGQRYTPATRTWTPMSTAGSPPATLLHYSYAMTPQALLLFGGYIGSSPTGLQNLGYRYDVAADSWFAIPGFGIGLNSMAVSDANATWTGTYFMIFGGYSDNGAGGYDYTNKAARYNPATASWSNISSVNRLSPRTQCAQVWTGTEWFLWGGFNFSPLADGKRYNPTTDTWTDINPVGGPTGEVMQQAFWTGSEVIVIAERTTTYELYRWSPATNTWSKATSVGAPSFLWNPQLAWTGTDLFFFSGGVDNVFDTRMPNSCAVYNPASDRWRVTASSPPEFAGRRSAITAWTGSEVLIFGGSNAGDTAEKGNFRNDLGRFMPTSNGQYLYIKR